MKKKGRKGILFTDTGTAYPCVTVMACTWNSNLMEKLGEGVGREARDMGTDIWYAPAVNIHAAETMNISQKTL